MARFFYHSGKKIMRTVLTVSFFLILCLTARPQVSITAGQEKTLSPQVEPPPVVTEKFKNEHPAITPSWSADGKNFRADFVDPESFKGRSIVYDPEGKVIRRESEVENSSYPQSINDYYIKRFPGEKYKTWRSQDNSGSQTYYIRHGSDILWFDKEGKAIESRRKK